MSSVDSRIVTMKFDNAAFERGVATTITSIGKLKTSLNFSGTGSSAIKTLSDIQTAMNKLNGIDPMKGASAGVDTFSKKSSLLSKLNPFTAAQKAAGVFSTAAGKLSSLNPFSGATKGSGVFSSAVSKLSGLNPFKSASAGADVYQQKTSIFSRLNPFKSATVGAGELQTATNKYDVNAMTNSVQGVSKSFIALTTVAVTALSNIVTAAQTAGTQMVKSLTVDPLKTGLTEYETNLNSVQTILANTEVSGATLDDVNKALAQLNEYSDETIYNFSDMAKNIGTFTAAGVGLDQSVESIKGIANLAALSGSNSQQAATAMYQLSQEIASGRVSLMGWNSVVNAGMGGSTFQRALANTAVAMGEIDESALKLEGEMKNVVINGSSFRDSIMAKPGEVSWLTKDVLTGTLAQFTGDLKKADIMAQGFNENAAESIMATARTAKAAATDVKTLSGVFDVARETAASGWSRTWQLIFGDFEEAKTLFSNFSDAFSGIIAGAAETRNTLLEEWSKMGGREELIEGFKSLFKSMGTILAPIKDAFRDIFPAKTADDLMRLTKGFGDFAENLSISKATAEDVKRTFSGVFAVFSIVKSVIGGLLGVLGNLVSSVSKNSGGFLDFTGNIGDFLVALDDAIKNGGLLTGFFDGLESVLRVPMKLIAYFGDLVGKMFSGFDSGDAEAVKGRLDGMAKALDPLASAADRVGGFLEKIGNGFKKIGGVIGDALGQIGDAIASAFTEQTFSAALDVINTALLGGILLLIKNFFGEGVKFDVTGGLFDSVKETLGAVTQQLQTMQAQVKADILMKIALALAVLTASIVVLSLIDSADLAKALTAMSIGFLGMQAALVKLAATINLMGSLKLVLLTGTLIALAAALLLMSISLKILASINMGDMVQALIGLTAMLFIMTKAVGPLSAQSGSMLRVSASLILLGIALNILALALKVFASMTWDEMVQGLVGMAGSLMVLAAAMSLMPKNILIQAVAISALSVAMNLLGLAVLAFGSLPMATMVQGILGMGAALGIIAVAMHLMPKNMIFQAASLMILSVAMNALGAALRIMGGMTWEQIAKGLLTVAGSLVILSVGLQAMRGTIGGAIALTAAAVALGLLAPVLAILGNMSWKTIAKGLIAIGGAFAVIGVAGLLLGPIIPLVIGLAAAAVLFGAAVLLAGHGAKQFAQAFKTVVSAGQKGVQIMEKMLGVITAAIPRVIKAFGQGIVEFVRLIGKNVVTFANAFQRIAVALLNVIIKISPKIAQAFLSMLRAALKVIVNAIPEIADAGLKLITGFLRAIDNNIGDIVPLAMSIITKFINGVANNIGKIIDAGANLIIKFINGVADAIRNRGPELVDAGQNLAGAIIDGMIAGLKNGASAVAGWAKSVASDALDAAKGFLGINSPSKAFIEVGKSVDEGFADGLAADSAVVSRSAEGVAEQAFETIKNSMRGLGDAVSGQVDVRPVISPILDLTDLAKEANKMDGLMATKPLTAEVSYSRAASISADRAASAQTVEAPSSNDGPAKQVIFEQHNHSPESLSPVEIYRNTKNLLALSREEIANAVQ